MKHVHYHFHFYSSHEVETLMHDMTEVSAKIVELKSQVDAHIAQEASTDAEQEARAAALAAQVKDLNAQLETLKASGAMSDETFAVLQTSIAELGAQVIPAPAGETSVPAQPPAQG